MAFKAAPTDFGFFFVKGPRGVTVQAGPGFFVAVVIDNPAGNVVCSVAALGTIGQLAG
jgi:hypothetical protein